MTSSKLLLPLRIPELGPSLGKLVSGTPRPAHWVPLDEIRYRLVGRIIEGAGEARRLAASDERAATVAALGRAVWQEAWDEAVAAVAQSVLDRITQHLEAEARAVGMGRRRRNRAALNAAERRRIAARMGAAGTNLIMVLDNLERCGRGAVEATGLERDVVTDWQEGLKAAARQLEAAWLALEAAIDAEEQSWRRRADEIARWRRPYWPVLLVGAVTIVIAVWLGLVFGGYGTAPGWFRAVWESVFGR